LSTVILPKTVTEVLYAAFYSISTLTSFSFESNSELIEIGPSMFQQSGLTSIVLPSSVTSIGTSAFYLCTALTDITLPDSLLTIGVNAFKQCTGLTRIIIPDLVTSIGTDVFIGCTSLIDVVVKNPSLITVDTTSFITVANSTITFFNTAANANLSATWKTIATYYTTKLYYDATYQLMNGSGELDATTVNDYRTANSTISKYVVRGYTSIGLSAFNGKTWLTGIILPPTGFTLIGEGAFKSCTGLSSIIIPSSVTSIGNYAIENSGLTSIIIPNSVTSIGVGAFKSITSLTSATLSTHASFTSLSGQLFYGCTTLASITIPANITSISNSAFQLCSALKIVTITNPSSTATVSTGSFYNVKGVSGSSITFNNIASYAALSTTWKNIALYYATISPPLIVGSTLTAFGTSTMSNASTITNAAGYGIVKTATYTDHIKLTFTAAITDTYEFGIRVGTNLTTYGVKYIGGVLQTQSTYTGITITKTANNYVVTVVDVVDAYIYGNFSTTATVNLITNIVLTNPYVPPPPPVFSSTSMVMHYNRTTTPFSWSTSSFAGGELVIDVDGNISRGGDGNILPYQIVYSQQSYTTDKTYTLTFDAYKTGGVDVGIYPVPTSGTNFRADNSDADGSTNTVLRFNNYNGYELKGTTYAGVTRERWTTPTKIIIDPSFSSTCASFYVILVVQGDGVQRNGNHPSDAASELKCVYDVAMTST